MRQTISGETLKKEVYNRDFVDSFLKQTLADYTNISASVNCLYPSTKIISEVALNYLNKNNGDHRFQELKSLIRNEFDECEKTYPFLGDLFVKSFFEDLNVKNFEYFLFNKSMCKDFCKSLTYESNKKLASWFFENASLENLIEVKQSKLSEIVVEKKDNIFFKLDYDTDFLGSKKEHIMMNYKFIIIDGFIESVGEIHHLLHKAGETKIPYVIFCFGMSPEVKYNILQNNKTGRTEVFPVIISFDENTINILNDLAVVHGSGVVSASLGQTISQEVRKELKTGKKIILSRMGLSVDPCCSYASILSHKKFLQKRLNEKDNEEGKRLIQDRIRNINSKTIKIYVPDMLFKETAFIRELDYILRFFKNIGKKLLKIKKEDKSFYYVPCYCIELVKLKSKSLRETFSKLEKLIFIK